MLNAKTLILVPTPFELTHLSEPLRAFDGVDVELCGFGPIAAAARAAALINQTKPQRVLLLGIAGSLTDELLVGHAYEFSRVCCYGVGVGTAENFQTAADVGWKQWQSAPDIGDCLPLSGGPSDLELLTCCSASLDQADVALRIAKFPEAAAEEMEGFGVATACRLAGVPVSIVRGISNCAGDRQFAEWQVKPALSAAIQLAKQVVNR